MNFDKIFELLHCDIDVLQGIENFDHNTLAYENFLTSFVNHSAFSVLKEMISNKNKKDGKRVARLLFQHAQKLGMNYLSDCLHDILGCITAEKWTLAKYFLEKVFSHINHVKITLQNYSHTVIYC